MTRDAKKTKAEEFEEYILDYYSPEDLHENPDCDFGYEFCGAEAREVLEFILYTRKLEKILIKLGYL